MALQSVLVRFVFLRSGGSRRLDCSRRTGSRAVGVEVLCVRDRTEDGRHEFQREFHDMTRVVCHDTKAHDRVHSKHHKCAACEGMSSAVWSHIASLAQHLETDLAQSGTGKRGSMRSHHFHTLAQV